MILSAPAADHGSNYLLSTPPELTFFFLGLLMCLVALVIFKKAGTLAMLICTGSTFFSAVLTLQLALHLGEHSYGTLYLAINALILVGYLALSRKLWKNEYHTKREWP